MDVWTLIVAGIAITLLLGLSWAIAAYATGTKGMLSEHRKATLNWALFNLLIASAWLMLANLHEIKDNVRLVVPATIIAISFAVLRRSLQEFTGQVKTDFEISVSMAVGFGSMAALRFVDDELNLALASPCLLVTFLVARSASESYARIRGEVGRLLANLVVAPMIIISIMFGVRATVLVTLLDAADIANMSSSYIGYVFTVTIFVCTTWLNMSLAIALIGRLMKRSQSLSLHDHLTGLQNRRFLEVSLQAEMMRSRFEGSPYSLIIIDIDRFKDVNDTYGHAVGDQALISVAHALTRTARQLDIIARLGGEEFCAVLPDTDSNGAGRAAERFRRAIETSEIFVGGKPVPITASFGVATCTSGTESWSDLMGRADKAMYRAKNDGRNRVRVCEADANGLDEKAIEAAQGRQ